jgi:hypothetical protein
MNIQLANLSTDLRRISYWIYDGKDDLVSDYLSKIRDKYDIDKSIGVYDDIWREISIIQKGTEGKYKSAEMASTLGSVLLQESLK